MLRAMLHVERTEGLDDPDLCIIKIRPRVKSELTRPLASSEEAVYARAQTHPKPRFSLERVRSIA